MLLMEESLRRAEVAAIEDVMDVMPQSISASYANAPLLAYASRNGFRSFVIERNVPRNIPKGKAIDSFCPRPKDAAAVTPFALWQLMMLRLGLSRRANLVIRTYSLIDRPNPECCCVRIKRESAHGQNPAPGISSNDFQDILMTSSKISIQPPRREFYRDRYMSRQRHMPSK